MYLTPFILLSAFRLLLKTQKKALQIKVSVASPSETNDTAPTRPEIFHRVAVEPVGINHHPRVEPAESAIRDFDAAVRYVVELSAVKFTVLLDAEGLPVAFAGDDITLRDVWAPVGRLVVERIQSSLLKAGDLDLQGIDLSLDIYRLHMASVCGMWLLVGADSHSEELEKVRIGQSVDMIRRVYEQRYVETKPKEVPEENYV